MKWVDNSGSGDFQQPEPGTYLARCVRLVDLGTQVGEYQGKPTARHQVLVTWELPDELLPSGDHQGEPYVVSKFYTASLHEKSTLRHDLTTWRGRDFTSEELAGFEAKNILGAPCLATLTENENGKIKVTAVTSLPRGTKVAKQINPSVFFSLEPDEFDRIIFEDLSDGIKAIIQKSPEYNEAVNGAGPKEGFKEVDFGGDDIPF